MENLNPMENRKAKSNRQKAIKLVRDAVIYYGRAVRLEDLRNFAEGKSDEFNARLSSDTIGRLVFEGEIYIAKQGRRDKYGGNFYLPKDIHGEYFTENLPLTWLDIVQQGFQELWNDKTLEAKANGELPVPPITEEVSEHILKRFGSEVFPDDVSPVAYALAYLSKPNPEPVLKKMRRERYGRVFWVPASAPPEDYCLDKHRKSKAETELTMVKSAIERLGRPATADEINSAVKSLYGKSKGLSISFFELTNKVAYSLLQRVGFVAGEWYYYYGGISDEECKAFLIVCRCYLDWVQFHASQELKDVHLCKLPTVLFGRLLLIRQTAKHIQDNLEKISVNRDSCQKYHRHFDDLLDDVKKVLVETEARISDLDVKQWNLPANVVRQTTLLDSEQLSTLLKPLLNTARKYKFDHKVSDVVGRRLKKYINHSYEPYFSGTSGFNLRSRYLYDHCEILIYLCNSIGTSLCRVLAGMAKAELGSLRDSRFIIPMLESNNFEDRVGAIACLAFLQISEHKDMLFQMVLNDTDPGVRQVALWAYAFREDADLQNLIQKVNLNEKNKSVIDLSRCLSEETALSV